MIHALLTLLLTVVLVSPAAGESAPAVTKRTTATLITEADTVPPDGRVRIALRLRMAEGWHTYWRNPGEAGVPAELNAELSPGAAAGGIDWPTPARLMEGTIITHGYTGEVVLPLTVTVNPGTDGVDTAGVAMAGVTGRLQAHWLVCKDICVPEEASFPIRLVAGTGASSAEAALFQAHDRATPRPSPWEATIAPDGTLSVRGRELTPATVAEARFMAIEPGQILDAAAQPLILGEDGFTLGLRLAKGFVPEMGMEGVLTVRDRGGVHTNFALAARAAAAGTTPVERRAASSGASASGAAAAGVTGTVAQTPATPIPDISLARVLAFAFLGGLILNLMPCVFPILAMKAVGLASGAARGGARAHGLAYTAGVLTTFAGLALLLLFARETGAAAGWGFQFASPVFVATMAWLLFAVGLNLSGVFRVGGGFAGMGGTLAAREGHWGSFFTGMLAVLVATPCTAPFMGVAIAAGLAAPPVVTVLVFLVMGLGLAAPYLALAASPLLGRLVPRPGRWMEVFRQALAFPMYGASVWLLWVVGQEAGNSGVLIAAAGFVLVGFAAWSWEVVREAGVTGRRIGMAGAAMALVLAGGTLTELRLAPPGTAADNDGAIFTPARLAALRAEGRPVFVNLTAAWCVTCLVNERVALGTDAVRRAFVEGNVAYLKGDWTRQDPILTAFLREQGRDGVPLYLYYAPRVASAAVLPQILTEGGVLAVLRPAS